MTTGELDLQQELLEHTKRQTAALENISSAVMFLLALTILGVVIGAAALFGQ